MNAQTSDDLFHGPPDTNMLLSWLSIIALGKTVQPQKTREIGYKSALHEPFNLKFSEAFSKRHPRLKRSYEHFAGLPTSAWRVSETEPSRSAGEMSKCVNVNCLKDFRDWLLSARRFTLWAGVGLNGVREHHGGITRYGRDLVAAP